MPIISACCCWDSLKTGSKASAVFTGVTGVVNIIINIWLLVQVHWLLNNLEANEIYNFIPPGILVFLYIELVFNLCLIGLAFCLAIGINRRYEGKVLLNVWGCGFVGFRCYDVFLLIYILVWLGGHRINDVLFICPQFNFVAAYWVLDTIFLIVAVICVKSYWQELFDEIYGKEKKVKFIRMQTNIRHAARGARSGTATPRSYYASAASLAPSHKSFQTQPSVHSYGHPVPQRRPQPPVQGYASNEGRGPRQPPGQGYQPPPGGHGPATGHRFQQRPPPGQGYPPQQRPPPGQGYPPPQRPPPGQGYPPQQRPHPGQGYPSQQYPPHGRGPPQPGYSQQVSQQSQYSQGRPRPSQFSYTEGRY